MPHTDTSPAAQAVQLEILRAMSAEQRLLLAFEMSLFARELAREGIRREQPLVAGSAYRARTAAAGIFSIAPSLLDPMSASDVLRGFSS